MGRQLRRHLKAVDAFGLPREEILFVAFAGWDVAGARWFGGSAYPTFWVGTPLSAATPPGAWRDPRH